VLQGLGAWIVFENDANGRLLISVFSNLISQREIVLNFWRAHCLYQCTGSIKRCTRSARGALLDSGRVREFLILSRDATSTRHALFNRNPAGMPCKLFVTLTLRHRCVKDAAALTNRRRRALLERICAALVQGQLSCHARTRAL